MRVLSLFSGYGGMDRGLEQAGIEVVGQCEIDKDCIRVLEHHWPNVRRWTDVRDVDAVGWSGAPHLREHDAAPQGERAEQGHSTAGIDLIVGGFPCQDVSVAGKRAGLDGARSGLWFEFHRIVRELRPKYVLVENVPGLLSSNEGRDFAVILDGLGELGFAVSWAVLDSQHFGVPQRRRRVFIVAGPTVECTEAVLALAEGCGGHPQTSRTAGEGAAGEVGGRSHGAGVNAPGRGGEDDQNLVIAHSLRARPNASHREDSDTYVPMIPHPVNARDAKGVNQREDAMTYVVRTAQTSANGHGVAEDVAHTLDGANGQAVAFQQNERDEVRLMGGDGQIAGALSAQPGMKQQNYIAHTLRGEGFDASEDGTGRGTPLVAMGWDERNITSKANRTTLRPISPTLHAEGMSIVGASVRRLTPTECLRLQGMADDWLDLDPPLSDGAKYRMAGNAVTASVAEWIGRRIMATEAK